jgi:hypothetical protein
MCWWFGFTSWVRSHAGYKEGVIRSMIPLLAPSNFTKLHLPWPIFRNCFISYLSHWEVSRFTDLTPSFPPHLSLSTFSCNIQVCNGLIFELLGNWCPSHVLVKSLVYLKLDYVTACFMSLLLLLDLRLVLLIEIESLFLFLFLLYSRWGCSKGIVLYC